MKNRLIVAAIGIPALLAVIFFTPIWGWGIVVAIMAAFCAWELLHTAMPKFVPRFAVYAGVCGAAIVLGAAFGKSELVFKIAAYVLFVTMFIEMMISFHKPERIPFQDLALVFTAGIVIPWMLSSLVRLGLNDPKAPYLLLPFVITWLSDSGAFFVGCSLGKTKLAPALSPHKTVEGCVGGFVCAIAAAMLYGLVLHLCGYRVQIGLLAIYGFFGSLAGQTGDLAFSAIKREHGVKDYSNLLPGHGGMLDRFDSTIFTAPMLELLVLLAPVLYLFLKNIWTGAAFLLVLLVALFKGVALPELNLDALIYYSFAAYAALHGRKWAEAVWSWKRAALGVCLLAVGIVLSRSYYTHYFVPGIVLYQLLAVIGIWMMVNERWLGEVRPFMTCTFFIYATHFVVVRFLNKAAALLFPGSQLVSMFMYVCMPLLAVTLCYQAARVLRRYRPDIWKTLNGGR